MYSLYPTPNDYYHFVITQVDQEEVFAAYGDFPPKGNFSSPFRSDRHPSCRMFRGANGKLYMVDDTTKESWDFIQLVQAFENLKFMDALEFILDRFLVRTHNLTVSPQVKEAMRKIKETEYADIRFQPRKWHKAEYKYWQDLGVSRETLRKFHVYAAEKIQVNFETVYTAGDVSTVFVYKLEPSKYQIYFPFRPKGKKFLCNTNAILGIDQVNWSADELIITKSMKDVIVLHEMGYNAIAPIGEGRILDKENLDAYDYAFGQVIIFNDFDLQGITSSIYYRMKYDFPCVFLTDGKFGTINYTQKDPADLVKHYGFDNAKKMIDHVIQNPLWQTK